jgi:hypothetical protein
LTREEQRRLMVLTQVQAGRLLARQAAQVLALSLRQCRRLLARIRRYSAAMLAHGNRGRPLPKQNQDVRMSLLSSWSLKRAVPVYASFEIPFYAETGTFAAGASPSCCIMPS